MSRHLLMLGGGHAHLSLLEAAPRYLEKGHRVTIVSPEPLLYYSGMGPGMLGGTYAPEEARFPIRAIAEERGVRWVGDRAERIDPLGRVVHLASGERLPYDVLSVNTGSSIAPTVAADEIGAEGPRVYNAKPVSQLLELRRDLEARLSGEPGRRMRIVVAGGGPAAVESVANAARLVREVSSRATLQEAAEIGLYGGRSVLSGFPKRAERAAVRALTRLGVRVHEADYVRRIVPGGVVTDGGEEPADVVLLATGIVPSRLFVDSRMPVGSDGSMAINEHLHCLGHHEVFGAGDCVWFTPKPLARAGVFAVRQSPVLVHNVGAALDGEPQRMSPFRPQRGYLLLLNLGDGSAIGWRRVAGIHVVGRSSAAWRLKDRIDRAFMRRYGSEAERGSQH
ncbi:MAG: NAD(P)/FAD-dependent oxidoreductase [Spirochaetota bacterium]